MKSMQDGKIHATQIRGFSVCVDTGGDLRGSDEGGRWYPTTTNKFDDAELTRKNEPRDFQSHTTAQLLDEADAK